MKDSTAKNTRSVKSIYFRWLIIALTFLLCYLIAQQTNAATFVVNRNGDMNEVNSTDNLCADSAGNCTLRAAIGQADALTDFDNITFALSAPTTINLTIGALSISKVVTITGPGARNLIVRRDPNLSTKFGIFLIQSSGAVTISGITIANGFETSQDGAGISNRRGSTLSLSEVTIRDNTTTRECGAGIQNGGTLNILNSTISNNMAVTPTAQGGGTGGGICTFGPINIANSTISNNSAIRGGGIYNASQMSLNNVTISNNTATQTGGGIFNSSGAANIRNTIIANNTSPADPDVSGTFTSQGNNLIGKNTGASASFPAGNPNANGDRVGTAAAPFDPLLGDLKNNGGQTDTRELLTGSPVIDAGNNCVVTAACPANNPPASLTTDQRGVMRQTDGNSDGTATVDIGAFEFQLAPTAASVTIGGRAMTADGRGIRNVVITMTASSGAIRTATTTSFGYYRFDDVQAGETYIITARGKRFTFSQPARVLSVNEDSEDINFVGYAESKLRQ